MIEFLQKNMTEMLTILAIVIGPILAIQVDRLLQKAKQSNERKMSIFKTLMATRGNQLSHSHVEALNRIDLEFPYEGKYKKVIDAWKEYFDNLHKNPSDEELSVWINNNDELLASLLFDMGQSLGFEFDKSLIKRNKYSPIAHMNIEREEQRVRQGLINILEGKKLLPLEIQNAEDIEAKERIEELQKLMIADYKSKTK